MDAGVSVDARQDQTIELKIGKDLVKDRAIRRAVALLGQRRVGGIDRQFRNNLASWCALYCNVFLESIFD